MYKNTLIISRKTRSFVTLIPAMDFIGEIFQYKFLTHAALACLLCGVACGMIGTYVVCRRLVFLSGGITHASFGGIGMAYYFGANPLLGALLFAVLSALGIETFTARKQIREDSAIGLLWSLGMAIGIIFIYLTPGYAPNLMSFLFGNILSVTGTDIFWMGVVDLAILLIFGTMYHPILFVAFDREYARSQNFPTRTISYLMATLVAVTIVISIRVVGIVLLISAIDHPCGDRQPDFQIVRTDTPLRIGYRRTERIRRPLYQLPDQHTFGRIHNICADRYAYCRKNDYLCSSQAQNEDPMKTVHKLVLKSYLGPMILTFFIVMFVLIMQFMWRYIDELVGKGLDMSVIGELMFWAAMTLIPMGLPLATLLAAIMTLGNLGENYELLALKSAGISLPRILRPLIIVVGAISIGSFFVANNLVPHATKKIYALLYDIRQQKQSIEFKDGIFFNGIDNMSIRVGEPEPQNQAAHRHPDL